MKIWVRHKGMREIKSERLGSITSLQQGGTSRSPLIRSFAAVTYTMAIVLASSNLLTPLFATYYALVYLSFGATAIGVGWLATFLDLNRAVQVFAVVIGSLCIITIALLLRPSRKAKHRTELTPTLQST